jgi:anti-sigma factor RsiW
MTCDDFMPFMDAYVDHELDEQDAREAEVHLESCEKCRQVVTYQVAFKDHFKQVLKERAPGTLEERLWASIDAEPVASPVVVDMRSRILKNSWVAAPLAAAMVAIVLLPVMTISPASSTNTPVIEQTLDWHRGNFPIEVNGPDPKTVAAWFGDKVDFPVRLPNFGAEATIVGARIAHVQDRRAAYVVYNVDGTRLSVILFNGEGLTVPSEHIKRVNARDMVLLNQRGYEVAVVQEGGVTYSIAGELPEARFVGLVTDTFQ